MNQNTTPSDINPGRLLEEYGDALFRFAMMRLHNIDRAEDVVQDALLAAFQARANYSGRSSEQTWLTGILKHNIVDFIRKQVRETAVDDIAALAYITTGSEVEGLFDERGHWITPPDDWGRPDKTQHNQQFLEAFGACLERLKPMIARVFTLRELVGQSVEEICNEVGITATNCGVILYRARMGLRRFLEVPWPDGNGMGIE